MTKNTTMRSCSEKSWYGDCQRTEPTLALCSFAIDVEPPFRLDLTVWALRRRALNRVDRWDGRTYRRTIFVDTAPIEVAVSQAGCFDKPRLNVEVEAKVSRAGRRSIRALLSRILGLQASLAPFYRVAAGDRRLNDLANQFRGMRPPRFPTIFEALANGIACQQLSLEAGLSLLNKLMATYGHAVFEHGYAYARSVTFYNKTLFWQWMRLPGDVVFAIGALLMAFDFIIKLSPVYPALVRRGERGPGGSVRQPAE